MKFSIHVGSYRVSPVFFLKANPRRVIVLLVTVLNRHLTTRSAKRRFWYSLISTTYTCREYSEQKRMYLQPVACNFLQMILLTQPDQVEDIFLEAATTETYKFTSQIAIANHLPTLAFKNLEPIRLSFPTANATSSTSAPVASQTALKALILEIR